jgi:D-sedoheptulose 7-phosphate isomerase
VNYIHELQKTLGQIDPSPLPAFVRACAGTLWIAGNGGSAAIAQHWACDLSKAAGRRVQSLGANPAVLTAWANDASYSSALAEELRRLARSDDALICLSCSGRSHNILSLFTMAQRSDMPVLLIAGATAPTYPGVPAIIVPHTDYGIIEDCFAAIGHWLTKEVSG